ncbi:MAG: ArnT family glycosyltransferase [Terriglobales bacterium]|jgi:4-amino-4-deoxy-L-arabinose transferase-like glycosyltransferase
MADNRENILSGVPKISRDTFSEPQRAHHRLLLIVLVAFVLRLAVMVVGHTYRITPRGDHFQFGWEMGRIARSIAMGRGFSSPTDLPTGPSAWEPPVYPYILAAVFKLFGIYSAASAFIILTFNSIFAALTCFTIYGIAEHIYGANVARAAAWTWAIFPYVIYWPTRVVWETSFTTFLLSAALLMTLRMGEKPPRLRIWIVFGALWGLIMLTNTAVVSMLPFCLLWILYRMRSQPRQRYSAAFCVAVAIAVFSPWIVRNYIVFDKFIFVRDNMPLELHMANNDESGGLWTRNEHPANDVAAMHEFQRLGELGFMDQKHQQFQQFLREHPGQFVRFTLERIFYFWAAPPSLTITSNGYDLEIARHTGFLLGAVFAFAGLWLTIRDRRTGVFLLACFLLIYPLPYYLVQPFPRYKAPIEPEMILLIVYLFWKAKRIQLHSPFNKAPA